MSKDEYEFPTDTYAIYQGYLVPVLDKDTQDDRRFIGAYKDAALKHHKTQWVQTETLSLIPFNISARISFEGRLGTVMDVESIHLRSIEFDDKPYKDFETVDIRHMHYSGEKPAIEVQPAGLSELERATIEAKSYKARIEMLEAALRDAETHLHEAIKHGDHVKSASRKIDYLFSKDI